MKNDMTDPELCIELLVSFRSTYETSPLSSGGALEASGGQCYAWRANHPHALARPRMWCLVNIDTKGPFSYRVCISI